MLCRRAIREKMPPEAIYLAVLEWLKIINFWVSASKSGTERRVTLLATILLLYIYYDLSPFVDLSLFAGERAVGAQGKGLLQDGPKRQAAHGWSRS